MSQDHPIDKLDLLVLEIQDLLQQYGIMKEGHFVLTSGKDGEKVASGLGHIVQTIS